MAAALGFLAMQPRDAFWGPDSGNRFIQVRQLLRTGTLAVDYPGRFLDPAFTLAPTGGHHFVLRDGALRSFYSPAFAILTAPLVAVFGNAGLFVIPILSALALIPLFAALARELGGERGLAAWAAVLLFATPAGFYGVVFWEHTLAVAVTTAGILLVLRNRPTAGGFVLACGIPFREEGYVAIASVVVALLVTRRFREIVGFVSGTLLVLVPLWIGNAIAFGHPLGLHATVYGAMPATVLDRFTNFFVYLFEFSSRSPWREILPLPAIALIALSPLRSSPPVIRLRVALACAAALAAVAFAALLMRTETPMRETLHTQGLVGAVPFAIVIACAAREIPRFLTAVIASALVLSCLVLNQADMGVVWGPRHFLWLMPLVVVGVMRAAQAIPRTVLALLIVAAVAIELHGAALLAKKLAFSGELVATVKSASPRVIVTDVFWVPEDLAAVYLEVPILFVQNDRQLASLLERLPKAGIDRVLFVASRQYRLISNDGLRPLLRHTTQRRRIGGSEPMLDLMLLDVRLGSAMRSSRGASPGPENLGRPAPLRHSPQQRGGASESVRTPARVDEGPDAG